VCAVERDTNTVENVTHVRRVIPIAGDFTTSHGRPLDPKVTRLKNSASNSDSDREGVLVEFNGGKYSGRAQKSIIQFECDVERTGNEEFDVEDDKTLERRKEGDKEEGGEDGDEDADKDANRSLRFISYKPEDKIDVLRLNWRTKYACEEVPRGSDERDESKGWGFFGWAFIM